MVPGGLWWSEGWFRVVRVGPRWSRMIRDSLCSVQPPLCGDDGAGDRDTIMHPATGKDTSRLWVTTHDSSLLYIDTMANTID